MKEHKTIQIENCWSCPFLSLETLSNCYLDANIIISSEMSEPPEDCYFRNGSITFKLKDN